MNLFTIDNPGKPDHGRLVTQQQLIARAAALQIGTALWYTLERPDRPFMIRKSDLENPRVGSVLDEHYAGIARALREGRIGPK